MYNSNIAANVFRYSLCCQNNYKAFKQAVIKHTQAKEELSVCLKKRIALVLFFFFSFRTQIPPAVSLVFLSSLEGGWEKEALPKSCRVLFSLFQSQKWATSIFS